MLVFRHLLRFYFLTAPKCLKTLDSTPRVVEVGLAHYQRTHRWIVFEAKRYRLMRSMSDFGQDHYTHHNQPSGILRELTNALHERTVSSEPDAPDGPGVDGNLSRRRQGGSHLQSREQDQEPVHRFRISGSGARSSGQGQEVETVWTPIGVPVYDFTWSRNRDGPMKMLAGYHGYLQADAAQP